MKNQTETTTQNMHDGQVEFVGVPQSGVNSTSPQPLSNSELFNLEHFEYLVTQPDTEVAARALRLLLEQLDHHYGLWGPVFSGYAPGMFPEELNRHVCTRLAGAITTLFSRPGFQVSHDGFVQLMNLHRWLALIFAVSSYRNADHIIRNINAAGGGCVDPLTLNAANLKLFCLCYYPDSQISLQPDVLWQYDRQTVVRLFLALISGRALPTSAAHSKREQLLAWLPEKLAGIDSLDFLPVAVLHDVVMHCSYADLPEKHAIKRQLNRLIRQSLQQASVASLLPIAAPPEREKPVIAIVLEWFTCQHSIYRTHSSTMRALRNHFHVVGVGQAGATDEVSRAVFNEFVEFSAADVVQGIVAHLATLRPDVVYYPSVGMFPLTIYLTNLRLAPLQLMALGHPATTHSDCIDGVLVEEDYLGDVACFSETVYPLPEDALPYLPPEHTRRVMPVREPFEQRRKQAWPFALPVRIAVCASVMKVNPRFLNTLAEITRRSRMPLQFCFYMGFAQGLTLDYLRDAVHAILPDAEVNAHMPVQEYQEALNSCELFVSPFPFGNTNGLVDAVRQGLPGVCMTGPEVHTHIDEGLFRRLGLPAELIAADTESYIRAVLLLAEDPEYREFLQQRLRDNDPDRVLFEGHPEKFAEVVYGLWQETSAAGTDRRKTGSRADDRSRRKRGRHTERTV